MKYNSIFHRVKYKEDRFYLEGLLHEICLIHITNKLHHRKCFVRILFSRCKTLETHSFATLSRSFLNFWDSWIKTRTVHFLWSNLFISLARLKSGISLLMLIISEDHVTSLSSSPRTAPLNFDMSRQIINLSERDKNIWSLLRNPNVLRNLRTSFPW